MKKLKKTLVYCNNAISCSVLLVIFILLPNSAFKAWPQKNIADLSSLEKKNKKKEFRFIVKKMVYK